MPIGVKCLQHERGLDWDHLGGRSAWRGPQAVRSWSRWADLGCSVNMLVKPSFHTRFHSSQQRKTPGEAFRFNV